MQVLERFFKGSDSYHIARKFGGVTFGEFGESFMICQPKPSKLVLTTNNVITDLLIQQTYFRKMLKKSKFTKLSCYRIDTYQPRSNTITCSIIHKLNNIIPATILQYTLQLSKQVCRLRQTIATDIN